MSFLVKNNLSVLSWNGCDKITPEKQPSSETPSESGRQQSSPLPTPILSQRRSCCVHKQNLYRRKPGILWKPIEVPYAQNPVDFHWQPRAVGASGQHLEVSGCSSAPSHSPMLPPTAQRYINSALQSPGQFSSWTELRAEDGSSPVLIGSAAAAVWSQPCKRQQLLWQSPGSQPHQGSRSGVSPWLVLFYFST